MDEYIDNFIVTSSWTDVNSPVRSSWDHTVASQINGIHHDALEPYRTNEQKPGTCLIASDDVMGSLPIQGSNMHVPDGKSTIFVDQNTKYGLSGSFFSDENLLQLNMANAIRERRISLPGDMERNLAAGSFDAEHGSIGSNGSEQSACLQSLGDSQSSSTVPQLWQPSFSSVSSLLLGQATLQNFGLQGGFVESSANIMGEGCTDNEFQQLGAFTRPLNQEHKELYNPHLPSFISSSEMNTTGAIDVQTHQPNNAPVNQMQSTPVNSAGQNGAAKPRTRARRGQATDPHSIAERLRREKIAERMKNLQELVPSSNKTDKASMLDEIIDYVKFLQLQVKVLSMSRLGAAGAVVPLITDIQLEGAGGTDLSDAQDSIAFEQEVVKLMESNVTTAMQLLQTKGLCLMPIALAAAISGRKGSSAAIPPERKKSDMASSALSKSSETMLKERCDRQQPQQTPNGCNGTVVKAAAANKLSGCPSDLKSKA